MAEINLDGDHVQAVSGYLQGLQASITQALERVEAQAGSSARFLSDAWEKAPGEKLQGQGITRIMEGGAVFERAGVGFSQVRPSSPSWRAALPAKCGSPGASAASMPKASWA